MDIVPLGEASNTSKYGGKASSLSMLLTSNYRVPGGFVIASGITEITLELEKELYEQFDSQNMQLVAVRSSAPEEDGENLSWAGQLETVLNVTRATLIEAVKECLNSAKTKRAAAYASKNNTALSAPAVIVQEMVQSEVSGVAFSVHPVTKDVDQVVIEALFGLGEALVSGIVTPDTYIVNKADPSNVESHISNQTKQLSRNKSGQTEWRAASNGAVQKLNLAELIKLTGTVKGLEKLYKHPVDVEWAKAGSEFYILQCRPITTLG